MSQPKHRCASLYEHTGQGTRDNLCLWSPVFHRERRRIDVERCVMVSDDNVSCHITPGPRRILSYSIVKRVVAWCKDIYILPNIICPFWFVVGAGKLVPASARSVGVAQRARTVGGRGRLWGGCCNLSRQEDTRASIYVDWQSSSFSCPFLLKRGVWDR